MIDIKDRSLSVLEYIIIMLQIKKSFIFSGIHKDNRNDVADHICAH